MPLATAIYNSGHQSTSATATRFSIDHPPSAPPSARVCLQKRIGTTTARLSRFTTNTRWTAQCIKLLRRRLRRLLCTHPTRRLQRIHPGSCRLNPPLQRHHLPARRRWTLISDETTPARLRGAICPNFLSRQLLRPTILLVGHLFI